MLAVPCHPGQSYHPSLDDHQEVLAEALAVETAILEKKMEEEQLIPTELSEVTKSVLMDGEVRSNFSPYCHDCQKLPNPMSERDFMFVVVACRKTGLGGRAGRGRR